MKLSALTGNLGLKIIALAIAIVLYYALKPDTSPATENNNDSRLFTFN